MSDLNSHHIDIDFEEVTGTDVQITQLYDLLLNRRSFISHSEMPSHDEHKNFVLNNEYRTWHIIRQGNSNLGSVYINKDNSIGLNLTEFDEKIYLSAISFILQNFTPMPGVPSQISSKFHIHVSPHDHEVRRFFSEENFPCIQHTYGISDD